jgi:hypothetical protein
MQHRFRTLIAIGKPCVRRFSHTGKGAPSIAELGGDMTVEKRRPRRCGMSGVRLTRAALTWALSFYAAHFWLVFALSMCGAIARFIVIVRGEDLPPLGVALGEAVTGVTRALLFGLAIQIGISRNPVFTVANRWDLFSAALKRHTGAFVFQFVVLGLAVVAFEYVPNVAMARWISEPHRQLAVALWVATKNPTVIAVTILWMTGVAHELMRTHVPPTESAGIKETVK